MTADVDCVAIKRVNAGQEIVVENMCLQRQVELHEKWRGVSLQSAFARHNTGGATVRPSLPEQSQYLVSMIAFFICFVRQMQTLMQ